MVAGGETGMSTPEQPVVTRKTARYGWVPDLPDARDQLYAAPQIALAALPPSADLRSGCPPVYNQGRIGSCTANAIAGAFEFDLKKQGLADFTPSRLFIYYNERAMEGHVQFDSGAQLRDGVKSVAKLGVCSEDEWSYDDTPATSDGGPFPPGAKDAEKPPPQCYQDALHTRVATYRRVVRNLDQMRGCLAAGDPFLFGFTVYESFEGQEVARTGVAPMPQPGEQVLGGHAVLAVGYDDSTQTFTVRNSWGPDWGQAGYFTLPYAYLTARGMSSDFWTIHTVT
jgi:C1A family cysteine protease